MSTALLVTMGMVASRMGGVFMIMPAFNARGVPKMTRILCILALTSIIAPMVPLAEVTPTVGHLVFAIATEVLVGVIIGGVVTFIFGSLSLANEFVTNQIGHGAAQLFDPMLKVSHGPISTLASLLAAGVFIGTNLHLVYENLFQSILTIRWFPDSRRFHLLLLVKECQKGRLIHSSWCD